MNFVIDFEIMKIFAHKIIWTRHEVDYIARLLENIRGNIESQKF